MRKIVAVSISIVCLVLGLSACDGRDEPESKKPVLIPEPESPALKVVSFNIRLSNTYDGDNIWDNRKAACLNMIRVEKPDMFGLQEAKEDQMSYMSGRLTDYQYVGVGRDDGLQAGEFMSIFFLKDKFELTKSQTYWLSETPDQVSLGWDGECRRTVTMVCLVEKDTKHEIYYFNTHLDHKGPQARSEGVKLLARLIRENVPDGVPVLLSGDMNSDISSSIFDPLREIGMLSARDNSPEKDYKGSYNGFGKSSTLIDHIFYRDVEPLQFKTLDGDYGATYISDHYPILYRYCIPD